MLLPLLFLFLLSSPTRPEPDNLHLKLIRPPQDPTLSRLDRIRGLIQSDHLRRRHRSGSISSAGSAPPPPPAAAAFEMPVRSGAYAGTGQYFVEVRMGTPAQPFLLVADTGSDLTWVKCRYGKRPAEDVERIFRADLSRTFRPISCSSEMCRNDLPFSLTTCPTPEAPCNYDYGYSDGSSAQGFYANESVTIALSNGQKKRKLKGLLVGCTSHSSGASFDSSDGVLGLGHSGISFASHAVAQFGGRFSYCLVDHLSPKNDSSYLTFGNNPKFGKTSWKSEPVQETRLLIDPKLDPYYGAAVIGVSVDGEVLEIPASVWSAERGGGAIVDSGTSLTMLAEPAYRAVVAALSRRLEGIPRVEEDPFEYCYNWTAAAYAKRNVTVPRLAVLFEGSARLEPPAKSYLIDVSAGVKCLGFTSASWPGVSTIGNIMQQEHVWEFDVQNRRLRFQKSTCTV